MKVIFRTDSGHHIGMGHVSRCHSLAIACKKLGMDISFICRLHPGSNYKKIEESGFELFKLGSNITSKTILNDSQWLGASVTQEIEEVNSLTDSKPDLFIIDHYSIDKNIEKNYKSKRIMAIDDIHREHNAHILLDQNLSAIEKKYKKNNEVENAQYFIGPRYALLSKDFAKLDKNKVQETELIKILSYFGGTDPTGECLKVLNAFLELDCHYELTILLPESHKDFSTINNLIKEKENITLLNHVENMAKAISEHSICLGACGVSSWERMSLKKPSIVISSANNQVDIAKSLLKNNYAKYIGSGYKTDSTTWKAELSKLKDNFDVYKEMAERASKECDGNGAAIVAREIYEYLNSNR